MSDLVTMAENKLDSLLAADDGSQPPAGDTPPANDDGQQPPAGGDDTPPTGDDPNNNPSGDGKDPDDKNNGQNNDDPQNQPPQDGEEDAGKGKKPEDDAGKPKGDEAPKELSDDELMAELEKRGLKVAKADEPDKKEEQQKPVDIPKPEELPESVWGGMKPVQRYIYSELPYITVDLVDSEGNKSQVSIKTPDQIPEGLVYADARAQARAQNAFDEQNDRANNMYKGIQQNSQQAREQQQQQQENQAIIKGVEQLQADGIVPKITAQPGTPEFDKDPGVIRANEILAYRQKILQSGENISVVSAGKMFKADNPDLYAAAPKPPVESPADKERREKSKNISGGGRGTQQQANNSEKANARTKYPIGMSAQDIAEHAGRDLD